MVGQGPPTFRPQPGFQLPDGFVYNASEVFRAWGYLCKSKYYCEYFANTSNGNYYLVPDSRIVPQSYEASATVVVDGRTLRLLKPE